MQYFAALKMGEKRVKSSQELLTRYAGHAMPALALKDNKDNKWEPVGEENLYALVKEDAGFMIALCDRNGIAKSIAQWFTDGVKDEIVARLKSEENMQEYFGKLSLPI
ncbi:MAG TPA: hypothetical protein VJ742_06495 [Nitrososphaera sp.]|nr:hypothetical protein [Nitrososphaera sp.]